MGLLARTVASPIAISVLGHLLDRLGTRRIALPTTVVLALLLSSPAFLSSNLCWLLLLMVGFFAGFGACLGPIVYSKSITAWFDKGRELRLGMTLDVAMCGVGSARWCCPKWA